HSSARMTFSHTSPRSAYFMLLAPPMKPFPRVFALAPDCPVPGRYMRVRRHFYDGIQSALPSVVFPEAEDFEWARPAAQAPQGPSPDREVSSEHLWGQIQRAYAQGGLDAVISYCFGADLEPTLIE